MSWTARPSAGAAVMVAGITLMAGAVVVRATAATAPVTCSTPAVVAYPDGSGASAITCEPNRADRLAAQLQRERAQHRAELAAARRQARRARAAALATPNVASALTIAAAAYGVPRTRLERMALCESGWSPTAVNGPYLGLFQFGTPLWDATPYRMLSRTDPHAAAMAAAYVISHGGIRHWPVCGARS